MPTISWKGYKKKKREQISLNVEGQREDVEDVSGKSMSRAVVCLESRVHK